MRVLQTDSAVPASLKTRLWPVEGHGYWIAGTLVAAVYALVAAISLLLAIPPGYASAVWPPAGIALAACLGFGTRIWPAILLGAALANLGVVGTTPLVALAVGAGNAAEAVAAAALIHRFVGLRHRFDRAPAVWRFAAIAAGAALLAATNGVTTLALAGQLPWTEYGAHWLTWWLGDATGIVIVTPLLLAWSEPGVGRTPNERRTEHQLFAALLLLLGALVWAIRFPAETVQKLVYLMLPLVIWAAARLDQRAVTAASFTISAVAILDMIDGNASMFAAVPLNDALLLVQLFVSVVALVGLTLSALAGEVLRANLRLEASQAELEERVRERTEELERTLTQHRLLAKRMVRIRDEERARLSADLHDGVAQDLTSLGVSLDLIQTARAGRSSRWLDERLDEAAALVRRASKALREIVGGLRLQGVEGLTLSQALRRHAAEFESRTGILVTVAAPPRPDALPAAAREALVRIAMEALANVARHADATVVRVTVECAPHYLRLTVDDDGRGFRAPAGPSASAGSGLPIMRERATALGARFAVHSAPGQGTRIECRLPLPGGS